MTPEFTNLFTQLTQELATKSSSLVSEIATKSADIAIEASKHTGVFVSFYDIGNTVTNIFKAIFK